MNDSLVIEAYANRVWIENVGLSGDLRVMVQSDAPGSEPVCVATIHYHHVFNDNLHRRMLAVDIALRFGAHRPVELRPSDTEIGFCEVER